jgi:nucleotide-binding universal stress UspA family protein
LVPSKVLVAVDGSPASLRALDFAIEMTGQNPDTSLVLLNVQNISAMDLAGAAMGSDWQEAASEASTKALKEAVGKAEAAGINFKSIVRTGQTAEAIAQHAIWSLRSVPRLRFSGCLLLAQNGRLRWVNVGYWTQSGRCS